MIIHPRHFVRFLDGRAGQTVTIAFLPGELGAHIGALQTNVSLRIDYAHKLLKRKLTYEGFELIQQTIDEGLCIMESYNRLSFLFIRDESSHEIWFLHLKSAQRGDELWLVTFHRISKNQLTRRLNAGVVLRAHFEREFMG
jgi:hypothetical protein